MLKTNQIAGFGAGSAEAIPDLVTTNLVFHIRADLGITKDGSDQISQWDDQTASGFDLTQATTADKPDYIASELNGHPVVRFPGGTEHIASTGFAISSPFHCFMVFNQVTWVADDRIWLDTTSHPFIGQGGGGGSTPQVKHNGGSALGNTVSPTVDTWYILQSYFNGASSHQALNNGSESTGTNVGTTPMDGFQLGGNGAQNAQMDIAEIAFYSAEVTGDSLTQNLDHFNGRYVLY
jgi:hypothetical protein